MIPILILAAGQSRRMRGADKLLEVIDGMPLLRKQTQMAMATGNPVFVAIGQDMPARAATIAGLDATALFIADADQGLSHTLRGGVAHLPAGQPFMVLLADLVDLTTTDLNAVIVAHDDHPDHLIWRGATADGKAGHPIIFAGCLQAEFVDISGDQGAASIVEAHAADVFDVALPHQNARLDLDTPEDWATWRARRC